ncbi:MAG: anaerobic ribonucleoside-triphosphate reductase activating protein [Candidatus Helarchaeota archaeon]
MSLLIGGVKEASTIDYPGEVVSVLFLCKCPFRCPFCQNWSLVRGEDCTTVTIETILTQIKRYQNFITGICVTGGEPTLQIDGLMALLTLTKKMGLLNKIDTNGFYSERIKKLISLNLVDYFAIDIKTALTPTEYGKVIGISTLGSEAVSRVKSTLTQLIQAGVRFETRTTIVPTLNDNPSIITQIAKQLAALKVSRYILQQFRPSGGTLSKDFSKIPATDHKLLLELGQIARKIIPDVRIRSIEAGEEKL